jgi:A/G-specific adenine glycosylase
MKSAVPLAAAGNLPSFRRALLRWYARHARDLPWRRSRDPYHIWISEIMLQQTTVVAVVPYFERFLQRFPTLGELAAAGEDDVLRLWEGLGYYSRARNILKAARVLAAKHDGRFPDDPAALLELPGIGRYTAGAIASFAFDRRAPIVEANTLRLYCRLLGYDGDPRSAAGQRVLWEFAERILPATSPGSFNQALMELGATVCTPENPACEQCPVRTHCAAATQGRQREIPLAARRPEITAVTEIAVAVQHRRRYLLLKRPPGTRWAGLWDFVRFGSQTANGVGAARPTDGSARNLHAHIATRVADETGYSVQVSEHLADLKHSVTRYRITLKCFLAEMTSGFADSPKRPGEPTRKWVAPEKLAELPLSVTGRKLANLLCARGRD